MKYLEVPALTAFGRCSASDGVDWIWCTMSAMGGNLGLFGEHTAHLRSFLLPRAPRSSGVLCAAPPRVPQTG